MTTTASRLDPKSLRRLHALQLLDRREQCEGSLYSFVKAMWPVIEPSRAFVEAWHVGAICEHLQAITEGQITRLLINVPPGSTKSLTTEVFFPAWEWGPRNMPATRYVSASYSEKLTIRDNLRFRRLVESRPYLDLWPDRFKPSSDQWGKEKLQNDKTGFKIATSVTGLGTGERGDRFVCDDPHSVTQAESDAVRLTTLNWFRETVPSRMNDPAKSAIVVIMQRVHEDDVSGIILAGEMDYEILMLPMRYDPGRHCSTSIGFQDPRGIDADGDLLPMDACRDALLDPVRFPAPVVAALERDLGPYASAAQLQQLPSPRGGGIILSEWWRVYPDDAPGMLPESFEENGQPTRTLNYPRMEYIMASLDTAYTEKKENDASACTVWGVFRSHDGLSRLLMIDAWQERLEFHALIKRVIETCRHRKVDCLAVEAKASGLPVAQEIARECSTGEWIVMPINPKADKVARAHAVVPLFFNGLVFAPDRPWAQMVIDQTSLFPRGKHDDLVDSVTQALSLMRRMGIAVLTDEGASDIITSMQYEGDVEPLYDV